MLHIETNKLKAAMECAATGKAEPRFYLKGVLLEITSCGDVHLVSTDGERMFFGRIPAAAVQWSDKRPDGVREIILPYDKLKEAVKAKRFSTFIEHLGGDGYNINGVTCQAIDGKFPNYRTVARSAFDNAGIDAWGEMDWGRVATLESALRTWSGNKTATIRVKGRGTGVGALVTGDDQNAFALVMPQKRDDITAEGSPVFPAALEEAKATA